MSCCHGCGGLVGRDCFDPQVCEMIAADMVTRPPADEWEGIGLATYCVLNGFGEIIAGGFDTEAEAIAAAGRSEFAFSVEARRVSRRRVWCLLDEAGQ